MKNESNIGYLDKESLKKLTIEQYAEELVKNSKIEFSLDMLDDDMFDCPYTDADVFRHGSCQLFAFALHEKFGYTVYKIEVNGSFHIFCKSNDGTKYIDVRGITPDFNVFITGSEVTKVDTDISKEYEFEDEDFEGEFVDIGLAFARSIIKVDQARYEV